MRSLNLLARFLLRDGERCILLFFYLTYTFAERGISRRISALCWPPHYLPCAIPKQGFKLIINEILTVLTVRHHQGFWYWVRLDRVTTLFFGYDCCDCKISCFGSQLGYLLSSADDSSSKTSGSRKGVTSGEVQVNDRGGTYVIYAEFKRVLFRAEALSPSCGVWGMDVPFGRPFTRPAEL